jgi:hypothetical protein
LQTRLILSLEFDAYNGTFAIVGQTATSALMIGVKSLAPTAPGDRAEAFALDTDAHGEVIAPVRDVTRAFEMRVHRHLPAHLYEVSLWQISPGSLIRYRNPTIIVMQFQHPRGGFRLLELSRPSSQTSDQSDCTNCGTISFRSATSP